MEDLFSFPKNTVIKTNEKLNAKASKKIDTKNLRQTTRDNNFRELMENDFNGLPTENKYFAIKTNGTSDCGSIFSYILEEWIEIQEMYLATWTISKQNIKRLKEAIESGRLKELTLVFHQL